MRFFKIYLNFLRDGYNKLNRYISIWSIIGAWSLFLGVSASGLIYLRLSGILPPGNDTWIFVNALYNTVSGNGLMTWLPHQYSITAETGLANLNSPDQSQLGAHAQPFLFILVPIYAIFPSVFTLIITQALALGLTALPIFKLSKEMVNKSSAYILVIVYLLYPTIMVNTRFFHPITFLPLFVFTMIYSYYNERTMLFISSLLLSLSIKETTPVLLIPLGLWLLYDLYQGTVFEPNRWKYIASISIVVMSAIWFIGAFTLFMPAFSEGPTHGLYRYSYLGSSLSEIVITLLTDPTVAILKLMSLPILFYGIIMLLPLAFIPLKSPKAVSVGLGIFIMNALADFSLQNNFHYQHQIPLVIALIFTMIITFHNSKDEQVNTYTNILSISAPTTLVVYSIWLAFVWGA